MPFGLFLSSIKKKTTFIASPQFGILIKDPKTSQSYLSEGCKFPENDGYYKPLTRNVKFFHLHEDNDPGRGVVELAVDVHQAGDVH